MNIKIVYFLSAVLAAAIVALWLYYTKAKAKNRQTLVLMLLRFLSFIALLFLLINPNWERTVLSIHKPQLAVAFDNSASLKKNETASLLKELESTFKKNQKLNDKFDISYFSFGVATKLLDSLDFSESQTDISQVLHQLNTLYSKNKTPIILISDGNQTIGSSYVYTRSKNPIYPIVVGDTTKYTDLKIEQLNSNPYAFLDNSFPVEIFTLYTGDKPVNTQLDIYENRQRIFSKKLLYDLNSHSQLIAPKLKADKIGRHFYTAHLKKLNDEKNTFNNNFDFSIEVVDQQTKVLLLSSFYHPDLGAIKKSIESNKQRKVTLQIGFDKSIKLNEYQLVILYQPTEKLRTAFNQINASELNSFIITGTNTDWNFLNAIQSNFSKDNTNQIEDYQAIYNASFNEFVTQDIAFETFSPLKDYYGSIEFKVPSQSLLFQKIGGIEIEESLLATYTTDKTKNIVLFGEGVWMWRMHSKIENQSFKPFDSFFNTLIQYAASSKQKQQLHLFYDKLAFNNDEYVIKASYVDQNYQLDKKASLLLYLINKQDDSKKEIPFFLKDNEYQVKLAQLKPGDYSFQVSVPQNGIKSYGNFKVLSYSIEQQFTSANKEHLQKLATQSNTSLTYANNPKKIIQELINDPKFQTIQKSKKISTALIDFRWLLAFIVVSLSLEWFIRKYKGLI